MAALLFITEWWAAGNPYDNALAESFVATLKTECFAGQIPLSKAAANLAVFD